MTYAQILEFWFGQQVDGVVSEETMSVWFKKDAAFDRCLRESFLNVFEDAFAGHYESWKDHPRGRLAMIILFDQFPRNMFRGEARSFSADARAVSLAKDGIHLSHDKELFVLERIFFYMPFEHSEDIDDQNLGVGLFDQLVKASPPLFKEYAQYCLEYAKRHRDVIKKFGRFPHRNEILGRVSTKEEVEFLKTPGSSF